LNRPARKGDKLIRGLVAGRNQSIVQEARHSGTKVSTGELLAKDRGLLARQNRLFLSSKW